MKLHTLYDIETQISAFFHITTVSVHDSKIMNEVPYETGAYYIFDRGYNHFKNLFRIENFGSYFVVRAKLNLQFKAKYWKRPLPENVLSDAIGELTVYNGSKLYRDLIHKVCYWDKEQKCQVTFLTNAIELSPLEVAELYKNR